MSYSGKVIMLTSDKVFFEMSRSVAIQSETLKLMIIDDCADDIIPIPNIHSKTMAKVIEYCNRHAVIPESGVKYTAEELKNFDAEFINVEQSTLFDLILAANYLEIKSLLDLTCQAVADMIKGKTPEEIRKTFNIENDFTEEEENEIRRENSWAFE